MEHGRRHRRDAGDQSRDYTAAGAQITGTGDTRTYDNLNRLITDTQSLYAATTQTWDADSRLLTVNDGSTTSPITYGYNADGHLTSMTEPGGSCYSSSLPSNLPPAGSGCILFDVDRDGHRLATYYPGNQVREQWTYNKDGAITELVNTGTSAGASTTFDDFTFDYYDINATAQTSHLYTDHQNAGSGSRQHYHYGVTGRFTEADQYDNPVTGSGTQTGEWFYCYFDDNNLKGSTTTVGGSCPTANTFDGANQQLGSGHSYDLNGDETSNVTGIPTASTTRTSTWTDSQQLATDSVTAGVTLNNTYAGPSNDRLLTSDTSATGQDQLRYDPRGVSEVTHTESGTQTSRYHVETDPNGSPIALRNGGTEYYLLVDQRGSIVRMVDANGVTQDAYHYTPYGQRIVDTNTLPQPLGYLASYTNSGTGLVHLGARWYDPDQGVFTQPDPQHHNTDPLQDNPYRYASNDPINNNDPNGRDILGDVLKGVGAALGVGAAFATGGLALGLAAGAVGLDLAGGVANGDSGTELAISAGVDAVGGYAGPLAETAGVSGAGLRVLAGTYAAGTTAYGVSTTYGG